MAFAPNYNVVTAPEHLQTLLSSDLNRVSLLNFWAEWAEPCKQMNEVVKELAKKYPQLLTLEIEAEAQADITESFDIEAVPSFIILRGHTLLDRISGADAAALTTAIAKHTQTAPTPLSKTSQAPAVAAPGQREETPAELEKRMRAIMNQSRVVLFMKGTPATPRCGFSRRITGLLNDNGVEYSTFDILEDEAVRQGLKQLNDWPTFPQLIINGEFVGGLDIVVEMVENGELASMLA
ncbi:glutaredoxin [Cylindrobasidium torrendii FP15055 ss-10]|uniref:Glutaredoxin n=1 Tax=Cylindrobasidium torrendii FP15055 ss-10 TaxID=1314674 RepID=A0A0D7BC99_9AGAR|nr:glutaredoxin [Cylindrobasidium torrendii FP15055 ss-10]